ncbi:toll-like receptor 4 [Ruditapes philippinarum]|uniref:toll-like receptor 4 n=1 Tax=Ruditapes philippinarum TaxID=129788 RepID=UPI00295A6ED7|nr:toll-like receptor 4 [Ruditapes philippinarum]
MSCVYILKCFILLISFHVHNVFSMEQNCKNLSATIMECSNHIPKDIADTVEHVKLVDINTKDISLSYSSFTGKGWYLLKQLEISTLDAPLGWIILYNNTFSSLLSLQILHLSMPGLKSTEKTAFVGLINLTELVIKGCKRLSSFYLLQMLKDENSMPNLNILKIDSLNKMAKDPWKLTNLDKEFFKALAVRNITDFSARNMYIGIVDVEALILVCDTLKTLDFSHSSFYLFAATPTPCNSLRHLVLNSIQPQNKWDNLNVENIHGRVKLYDKFYFFKNIVNLNYDNFFTNVSIVKNTFLHVQCLDEFNFKEISVQNNLFRNLDVVLKADLLFKKLEKLELQGNTLEYLNGGIFTSMSSLKTLNMSNNRIDVMQKINSSDFENILYHLKSLKIIDLSNNGLTFLPSKTFKNNPQLTLLYLSNNRLGQITLSSTFSLSLVDLQSNAITHLDQKSRQWFDEKFQYNKTYTKFVANLYGNPFQCICKYETFLQWIVHTPLVGNPSQTITCSDHEHDKKITVQFTKNLNKECQRATRLRNMAIVSSITIITVIVTTVSTVAVCKHRRKKLRQKRTREEIVAQIQDNNYHFQYPVFLSYSNEDVDLVMEHVYPDLVGHLRRMFDTPRDLVCTGDRNFRPGRTIFDEIDNCLNISAIAICVVSHQFCQSNFCKYEFEQAFALKKPIMLIFIEEVDEQDMSLLIKQHFNNYTRISLRFHNGDVIITPNWERVCESILDFLPK